MTYPNYNKNEYYPDIQIRNFPTLESELESYYDYFVKDEIAYNKVSPRGQYEYKIGFKEIFYYISWLYDNNPQRVIDIGAGECFWKRWFSNITSLDPGNYSSAKNADIQSEMTEAFVESHVEHFDCGMALNSLHFGRITKVGENIQQAMRLIKPNGRFLFTISTDVIQNQYPNNTNNIKNTDWRHCLELTKEMVQKLPYNILLFDVPHDRINDDFPVQGQINGTLRFILEK
jgi:hypothetical protein